MQNTHSTSRSDIDESLKQFLKSCFSDRSPGFEATLERVCFDLIGRAEVLSRNYWISESEMSAIRCAATLIIAGAALAPKEPVQSALSLGPLFFKERPELQKFQAQVLEALNSLKSEYANEHRSDSVTYREIFYDAVISMDAHKEYEDQLILKNSIQRENSELARSSSDWIRQEIENLKSIEFRTFAGKVLYSRRLEKNLAQTRELKSLFEGNGLLEDHEKKLLTLYRSASRNMIDMISIADKKAGLLLSANAISLSLVVSFLSRGSSDHPRLWLSAVLIAGTCALTVLFASLAARPVSRDNSKVSLKELLVNDRSVLHYGNAARLHRDDFIKGFKKVMNDNQLLEDGLIEELHFYSIRIIAKLKMVRFAYITMFSGIILSFLAFAFSKYL